MDAEVLVIGSGAGGATTAAVLAEAGFDVLVVEEGEWVEQGAVVPFSLEQMDRQYRSGGVTVALGLPSIAYTEGRCAGGGTEINSGLYRRPPDEVLERWAHRLRHRRSRSTTKCGRSPTRSNWRSTSTTVPGPPTAPSDVLRRGAERLGWQNSEIPRWMKYADNDPAKGQRQSMTRTYLPRAVAAGARLVTGCRIDCARDGRRQRHAGARRRWRMAAGARSGFATSSCAAARSRSPALLQRSRIAGHIGRSLAVHPTVKLAARFADELNVPDDVPVHQVKEFAPDLSFGGSASQPGLVALALSDQWATFSSAITDWRRISVYYAAITSEGRGKVRAVRGLRDPIVTYGLTRRDRALLGSGLARLALLMLEAGADEVYPSFRGAPVVRKRSDLAAMQASFSAGRASVMTVHLCSTVPMGEDRAKCGAELVRSGARHGKRVGQRRLAAADRAGRQPAGHGDGVGDSQRPALRRHGVLAWVSASPRPQVTVVTGASGWLGRALGAPSAGRRGASEVAAARPHHGRGARRSRRSATVEVVIGDIAKPDTMARLLHGAGSDADVIHTAGIIHPTDHGSSSRSTPTARATSPRQPSTTACAGSCTSRRTARSAPTRTPATRSAPNEPYHPYYGYGRSKMQAELAVLEAVDRGLDATIVRPPWFYGPFQPPRQTTFFRLVRAGRFPVVGDGEQRRSMVYVDNLVDGVIAAELTPAAKGKGYWIADAAAVHRQRDRRHGRSSSDRRGIRA